MKTLKFFGSTVLLCLFVVACAKSNKEEQARLAGTDNKGTVESDISTDSRAGKRDEVKFDVEKEGYTSKNVVLTKNSRDNKSNTGQIIIFDEDARRLYERMKIVATSSDKTTDYATSTNTKQGKNLACSEFIRDNNSKTYSCIIVVDYRTGKLAAGDKAITADANAKVNTAVYTGKGLSILEGADGNGILSVACTDAKVLFDTLSVEEKSLTADGWLSSQEKLGANLRCYKHSTLKTDAAPSYTCSLSIGVNDGTVKASDVTASVKKEEVKTTDDTKTDDSKEAPATDDTAA